MFECMLLLLLLLRSFSPVRLFAGSLALLVRLKKSHKTLNRLVEDLKSDRPLVLAAVRENGLALSHAAKVSRVMPSMNTSQSRHF